MNCAQLWAEALTPPLSQREREAVGGRGSTDWGVDESLYPTGALLFLPLGEGGSPRGTVSGKFDSERGVG
jgi:hypothetical protein